MIASTQHNFFPGMMEIYEYFHHVEKIIYIYIYRDVTDESKIKTINNKQEFG